MENLKKTTKENLQELGLDWEVKKVPLVTNFNREEIKTDYFGVMRTDNHEVLSTCKKTYEPSQNEETIETLKEIAGTLDLEIVKGGPINGGRKIFVTMKPIGDFKIQIGDDTVSPYIFAINSHDGSSSLAFGTSNIVHSCNNQFFQFYRKAQLKFRHTASYRARIDEALKFLEARKLESKNLYKTFEKFTHRDINKSDINNIIMELEGVDLSKNRSV